MIRDRLKIVYSRPKSYTNNGRIGLEFEIGDWVYLNISPMKEGMRYGKKGKPSPRYVGPYEIFKQVGKVAYELKLLSELALVHPVFHVFIVKKCIGDPMSILSIEGLGVNKNLSFEEFLVEILYLQVNKLRNKKVTSVKVIWRNHLIEGATCKAEADMKSHYPHLFPLTSRQG